jgi:hypothetical protein
MLSEMNHVGGLHIRNMDPWQALSEGGGTSEPVAGARRFCHTLKRTSPAVLTLGPGKGCGQHLHAGHFVGHWAHSLVPPVQEH